MIDSKIEARWGHLPHFIKKGTEWYSACPACGEYGHDSSSGPPDRFFITLNESHGEPAGHCRRCGHHEWLYEKSASEFSTEQLLEMERNRRQYIQAKKRELEIKVRELTEASYWRGWHDGMTENDRLLWKREGIPEWAITMHKLGVKHEQDTGEPSSLTIPYWNESQDLVKTLQYRLLHVDNGDKYRFAAGLEQALFYPWPMDDFDIALVVEGAKKGLVTQELVKDSLKYNGKGVKIIAIPAKLCKKSLITGMTDRFERVIWALDPDAYDEGEKSAVSRNASLLPEDMSLAVKLPEKIDDMILEGSLSLSGLSAVLSRARPIKYVT